MSSRSAAGRARAKLAAARQLSWPELWFFTHAWAGLVFVAAALRLAGFRRLYGFLDRLGRSARGRRPTDADAVHAASRLVDMAARNTGLTNTCLRRSVVLWWLMRRRGFDVTLKLGARWGDAGLEAHAWVEHAGVVVNDPEAAAGGYRSLELGVAGRES